MSKLLDSNVNISDINITPGKPFQVETSGILTPVELEPPIPRVTPFQAEIFALNLINSDRRLLDNLIRKATAT